MQNKAMHMVSFILLLVGGLNSGLVGLFQFDLVATILGGADGMIARIVYTLVGVSAVYIMATHKKDCKVCGAGKAGDTHTHNAPV